MRNWGLTAAGLALLAALGTTGCEERPADTRANAGFLTQGSQTLTISDVAFDSDHIVGNERWQVTFKSPEAGSQMIAKYGLSTRLGEKLYDVKPVLPIINNGKATMWVGPLPDIKQAGQFTVEFWIIDDQGKVSNRMAQELTLQ
jgi:hypothetical protein